MLKQILKSSKVITLKEPVKTNEKELSENLNIPYDILKAYNNWYEINDTFYYFKELNDLKRLVNELLGVALANYFKLKWI